MEKTGYSTHGRWADSKEIYSLEEERGNIVDGSLLADGCEAIWITRKPEDAARYLRFIEDRNKPVTEDELDRLEAVDLTNAKHVESMDDGDGGELWIRKR
jgi:hypothetical protein